MLSPGNMKKVIKILFVLSLLLIGIKNIAYADTPSSVSINLKIYAGDTVLFNGPEIITACAGSPEIVDPLQFTINGKCAVEQSKLSNTWTWKYTPSGWLDELGGYKTTPDFSKSWGYFVNLTYGHGSDALNQYQPSANDELLLTYNSYPLRISASKNSGTIGDTITFTAEEESTFDANYNMIWTPSLGTIITLGAQSCTTITDGTCSIVLDTSGSLTAVGNKTLYVPSNSVSIEVSPLPTPPPAPVTDSGHGGSYYVPPIIPAIKAKFDLKKAFDFLIAQQKSDGSFGENLYTDWTAIALASGGYPDSMQKLIKYFEGSNTPSALLTDYERHAMTLMTLGINPYDDANGVNYIKKITSTFDDKQFGDINEDNDDIFALIVLQNAGYTQDDKIIKDDTSFILSKQKDNGSWDESADMTGAAIESLSDFSRIPGVRENLIKAKNYLKQNQKDNGGWSNTSSTAWALEGIRALGEKTEDWKKGENTPLDYLTTMQDTDGGIKNEILNNKIWETAYVISALSEKTWNQIMQKFEKPIMPVMAVIQKKSAQKIAIKTKPKLENLTNQNTASVINAIIPSPTKIKPETPKKNWWSKFWDKIFSIF